jgi:iron-sulfur cluster assembly protein
MNNNNNNNIQLSLTPIAANKIMEFMEIKQPLPSGVRIFVYRDGGGNVNYGMNFIEKIDNADIIFNIAGITFVTDPNSAIFLNNITLDFVSIGVSQGFTFRNDCSSKNCFNCNGSCHAERAY